MPKRDRTIAATLTANNTPYRQSLRQAGAETQNFTRRVEGMGARMRKAFRDTGIGRVSGRLKQLGGTVAAFAGVYGIANQVNKVKDYDAALVDLAIRGKKTNAWAREQGKVMLQVARATGQTKEDIAAYALKYVELTGNANAAVATMKDMAVVATATGANMSSLASIMDQLAGSFGLTGKQAKMAFGIIRAQEKAGAVGFSDLQSILPEVAAIMGTSFGKSGRGTGGLKAAGAMIQLARRTSGTATEAGTSVKRYLENLGMNRMKIEKVVGGKLMEGGEWKGQEQIAKMIGAAMQDPKKQIKLGRLLGVRGIKLARAFAQSSRAGWDRDVGDRQAAGTIFRGGRNQRTIIGTDFGQRMSGPAARWKQAMADIDAIMTESFLPILEKIVDVLPKVAEGLKWAVDNFGTLFRLWLAWKASGVMAGMMRFAQAMSGGGAGAMGGGGIAAAGGGVGTRGVGTMQRIGGALPIAGAALSILGGGASAMINYFWDQVAKAQRMRLNDLRAEIAVQKGEKKKLQVRGKQQDLFFAVEQAKLETVAGVKGQQQLQELLPGAKGAIRRGGGAMDLGITGILKRGGLKGAQRHLGKLHGLRGKLLGQAREVAGKAGIQLTDKQIAESLPSLQILDKAIKQFDKSIAMLMQGKKINVHVNVPIGKLTPGGKVANRSKPADGGSGGALDRTTVLLGSSSVED